MTKAEKLAYLTKYVSTQGTDGHYTLTLDTTEGHSLLTYTVNATE